MRVINCDTAHDMWNKLCSEFVKQSVLVLADLLGHLHSITCPEGGDPLKTIDEIVQKVNEYAGAGGELKSPEMAAILIQAMPTDYTSVIQTFVTTAALKGDELDFTALVKHLTEAIKLAQTKAKREREEATAMAARFKSWKAKSDQTSSTQPNHDHDHNTDSDDVVCYNCNGTGHISRYCPSKRKSKDRNARSQHSNSQRTGRANQANDSSNESNTSSTDTKHNEPSDKDKGFGFTAVGGAQALKASSSETLIRYLDTGASEHFDPDINNFVDIQPCNPFPITVPGETVIYATQIGTIKFVCSVDGANKILALSNVYYTPGWKTGLISLGRLRRKGYYFSTRDENFGEVRDTATDHLFLKAPLQGAIYPLRTWRPAVACQQLSDVSCLLWRLI